MNKSHPTEVDLAFAGVTDEQAISDAKRREFLQLADRLHKLACDLEDGCRRFEDWCQEQFSWFINNGREEDASNFVGNVPTYLRIAGRQIRDMVNHSMFGEGLGTE